MSNSSLEDFDSAEALQVMMKRIPVGPLNKSRALCSAEAQEKSQLAAGPQIGSGGGKSTPIELLRLGCDVEPRNCGVTLIATVIASPLQIRY
jgi:hypothetical protein